MDVGAADDCKIFVSDRQFLVIAEEIAASIFRVEAAHLSANLILRLEEIGIGTAAAEAVEQVLLATGDRKAVRDDEEAAARQRLAGFLDAHGGAKMTQRRRRGDLPVSAV